MNNEQLVKEYQNGSRLALKAIIKRFHPILEKTIRYYTRSTEPVEDLVQDCWYVIIPKLEFLELHISLHAWVHSIAKRKAIDWIRSRQRTRRFEQQLRKETGGKRESRDQGLAREKVEKVQDCIRKLPASQRLVLNMFYIKNLRLQEIAEVLDVSEGTVKSRLYYAREKLKQLNSN